MSDFKFIQITAADDRLFGLTEDGKIYYSERQHAYSDWYPVDQLAAKNHHWSEQQEEIPT